MVSSAQLSSAVLYPPQKYFGVHPRGFWGFWGCALMDITVREYLMEQWDRGKSLERTNFRGDSRAEQTGQRWGDPKESEPPSLGSPSPSQKQQGGNGNTDVNGGTQSTGPTGHSGAFWGAGGHRGGCHRPRGRGEGAQEPPWGESRGCVCVPQVPYIFPKCASRRHLNFQSACAEPPPLFQMRMCKINTGFFVVRITPVR